MGIFDWFSTTPSNIEVLNDAIWLTEEAKFNGISKQITQSLGDPDGPAAVVLVAHFQDTLERLQALLAEDAFDGPVTATTVEQLLEATTYRTALDESQMIEFLIAERHLLATRDEAVLEFATGLPTRCRLGHHVSLKDLLMTVFVDEWVENMLKQLGMQEDEAIEGRLIARRVKDCQKRIAAKAFGDEPAPSAREWMKRNCPELVRQQK